MNKHPEQRDNEILLGNIEESFFSEMVYKTKRKGKIAWYADLSEPLPYQKDDFFPVFVDKDEYKQVQKIKAILINS